MHTWVPAWDKICCLGCNNTKISCAAAGAGFHSLMAKATKRGSWVQRHGAVPPPCSCMLLQQGVQRFCEVTSIMHLTQGLENLLLGG